MIRLLELQGRLFDWDPEKNTININKHGISFKEAATVFSDEHAVEFDDEAHSQEEERFIIIGRSKRLRVMVVCHCYRVSKSKGSIIRIISARKAAKHEEQMYGGDD